MNKYNDKLDPELQVDTEEAIAAIIFDGIQEYMSSASLSVEDMAGDLGRQILKRVLKDFRPDLLE